jgi:hypothetical protein
VVLAANTGTVVAIFTAIYVVMILVAWIATSRGAPGRRRAYGCSVGLAVFFGLLVVAFAAWAADNIF